MSQNQEIVTKAVKAKFNEFLNVQNCDLNLEHFNTVDQLLNLLVCTCNSINEDQAFLATRFASVIDADSSHEKYIRFIIIF